MFHYLPLSLVNNCHLLVTMEKRQSERDGHSHAVLSGTFRDDSLEYDITMIETYLDKEIVNFTINTILTLTKVTLPISNLLIFYVKKKYSSYNEKVRQYHKYEFCYFTAVKRMII